MDIFSELRRRHPQLIYRGFEARKVKETEKTAAALELTFLLDLAPEIHFRPTLTFHDFPWEKWPCQSLKDSSLLKVPPLLAQLFFQLGLAEIPSYWKAACPAEIVIDSPLAQNLKQKELAFWHDLLLNGLGEFFYQNHLDFSQKDFVHFRLGIQSFSPAELQNDLDYWQAVTQSFQPATVPEYLSRLHQKNLIPVGGGKDSTTVLTLLEQAEEPYDILLLEPHSPAAKQLAELFQKDGHCDHIYQVTRKIDPQLLALNQQGYWNGHTPFSAYLAMVSVVTATIFGLTDVILGNESSADEENSVVFGRKINHQYSKSSDFEAKFQHYLEHSLYRFLFDDRHDEKSAPPTPHYFSLLRSLSELAITQILCQFALCDERTQKSLTLLRSCNIGQQQGVWCHHCPKCAFVFLMFSAFLAPDTVSKHIFEHNLFFDESLKTTFRDLAGLGNKKPFECVGTFQECQLAIQLAVGQYQKAHLTVPPLLQALVQDLNQHREVRFVDTRLKQFYQQFADKKIAILGLGREGLSNYHFLRQLFPKKPFILADQHRLPDLDPAWQKIQQEDQLLYWQLGPQHLSNLATADYIFKTAGIPITLPALQEFLQQGGQITSNTATFFQLVDRQQIIGITGTKGKSTTSTLIAQILTQAGLPVVFVGNIGKPALDFYPQVTAHTWVVYELSAHQLAELKQSPHIAVVQDIFPEHLDYYKDLESYFQAKSAIVRFQTSTDICIYNPDLAGAARLAGLSPALKFHHSLEQTTAKVFVKDGAIFAASTSKHPPKKIIDVTDIPLLGKHNLYNVCPAIVVAQLLHIPSPSIRNSIRSFQSLPHRLQPVALWHELRFYDDSISTNPPAAIQALQAFPTGKVTLLAGGYERFQDFHDLAKVILQQQVPCLIVFPPTGERLEQNVLEVAKQTQQTPPQIFSVNDMKEAVRIAIQYTKNDGIILLSPAAASFGIFMDYRDRGYQFQRAIHELTQSI